MPGTRRPVYWANGSRHGPARPKRGVCARSRWSAQKATTSAATAPRHEPNRTAEPDNCGGAEPSWTSSTSEVTQSPTDGGVGRAIGTAVPIDRAPDSAGTTMTAARARTTSVTPTARRSTQPR